MELKTFMRRLDVFLDFTSMIGFRFMHSRHALWFRLIAFILIFVSLGLSVYQSIDRFEAFINNPIVINIDQNDADSQQLPLVYICSDSQYQVVTDATLPLDVVQLLQKMNDPNDIKILNKAQEQLPKLVALREQLADAGADGFRDNRDNFLAQINETSQQTMQYLPAVGARLNLQPLQYLSPIDDNMTTRVNFATFTNMQARWDDCWRAGLMNKTSINSTLIKVNYATTMCEIDKAINQLTMIKNFNWENSMKSAEGSNKEIIIGCLWLGVPCLVKPAWSSRGKCFEVSAPAANLHKVNITGNKAAIKIIVDTRPLETDSVVQLLLRSPVNLTDTALIGNGFDVQAGSDATFAISKVTQIARIGSNCGTRSPTNFVNYTYEACLWEQRDAAIMKQCHCRWYFSPNNGNTTSAKTVMNAENMTLNACNITQHFSCIEDAVFDPEICPDNCYDTIFEVDRTNFALADDTADSLPANWNTRVNTAIDQYASQARKENLVTGPQTKLKSLTSELFNLYLELFYEYWNDERCDPILMEACSSLGNPFIPFWMTEADDIDGVLKSSLFNQYPIDFSVYHKQPNKTPCSYVSDVNSTLISDEVLNVLTVYNNTLRIRREENNSSDTAIDVTLSTYDQLLKEALSQPDNDTLRTAARILQLLKQDIVDMLPRCINNTNITDYHYCFFFYNSEVLRMTSAADVANFNDLVATAIRKPGAVSNLQKQFRLYATQGLPTVLSAALLKKNFLAARESFEAQNYWQSAMVPFLDWLNGELYINRTCPSVVEICTSVKQRTNDYNLASAITFNSSALNLVDFVRYYSVDAKYNSLATMITNLRTNLNNLKSSYADFLSSLKWSVEDKFGVVLTEQVDDAIITDLFNCTSRQLAAIERLLNTTVLFVNQDDGTTWLSALSDLLNSEAMGVYRRGAPYIKKSIATMTIFYRSFSVQNVVQTNSYNVWTFLSDIGGTMGLYLGATLLTFFELIAFFVHGEETIAKANFEARLRTPSVPRLSDNDENVLWGRAGSPKFVQYGNPATIGRSVTRVSS